MDTSYAEVYVNGTLVDDDGALLNGTVDTLGDGARAFLGLCAIVTVHDGEITRDKWDHNYMIGSINRKSKESPVQRLQDEVLDECRASMEGIQIGALLGCVTLIFGLVGTINRMRFASDANVQKGLGLITDTWGALALGYTLLNFSSQCYWDLPPSYRDGATKYDLEYAFGPGFYCYVFCAGSGLIRAAAHWLTPTPGNGSGACKAGLPEYLLVGTRHHADFDEAPKDAEPAPAAVLEEPTPSTPGRLTPRRASKRISMAWGAGDAPLGTETPLTQSGACGTVVTWSSYHNRWSNVCDDSWGVDDATVFCRDAFGANYVASSAPCCSPYGAGSYGFYFDDVACAGTEDDLDACTHSTSHNCGSSEYAGACCEAVGPTASPTASPGTLHGDAELRVVRRLRRDGATVSATVRGDLEISDEYVDVAVASASATRCYGGLADCDATVATTPSPVAATPRPTFGGWEGDLLESCAKEYGVERCYASSSTWISPIGYVDYDGRMVLRKAGDLEYWALDDQWTHCQSLFADSAGEKKSEMRTRVMENVRGHLKTGLAKTHEIVCSSASGLTFAGAILVGFEAVTLHETMCFSQKTFEVRCPSLTARAFTLGLGMRLAGTVDPQTYWTSWEDLYGTDDTHPPTRDAAHAALVRDGAGLQFIKLDVDAAEVTKVAWDISPTALFEIVGGAAAAASSSSGGGGGADLVEIVCFAAAAVAITAFTKYVERIQVDVTRDDGNVNYIAIALAMFDFLATCSSRGRRRVGGRP
ncbi:endonuclease [Aureococcus anophagefferens]|nr:endonuclease [Aureococcus anophagefferens]